MSDLEVLAVTMKQNNLDRYYKMNIKTNVIFANQAGKNCYEENNINGNKVRMITTSEIGVGKNRNQALLFADGDICLLSDDDVTYLDDYEKIVKEAFVKIPQADIVVFNIDTIGKKVNRRRNDKIKRINIFNFQNYGAVRVAFKKNKILEKNIWFSTLFGGGTKYSSGEDTLFLRDALRKNLKIYTYPKVIATVDQSESTWFEGYNDKFFFDKGALLYNTFPVLKYLFAIIYFPLRFKKHTTLSLIRIIKLMLCGMKAFPKQYSYEEWISKRRDRKNENK